MKMGMLLAILMVGCAGSCSSPDAPSPEDLPLLTVGGMIFRRISPGRYGLPAPDFYLLETEVTNEQYLSYLLSTSRVKDDAPPKEAEDSHSPLPDRQGWERERHVVYEVDRSDLLWKENRPPGGTGDFPVSLVRLQEASSFCAWMTSQHTEIGKFRLPTLEEWRTAAYGADRPCPWGASKADATKNARAAGPEPVRQHPEQRTPEGVYGMWGNVAELLRPPPRQVAFGPSASDAPAWVGGSYADPDLSLLRNHRGTWWDTQGRSQRVGFRVLLEPRLH